MTRSELFSSAEIYKHIYSYFPGLNKLNIMVFIIEEISEHPVGRKILLQIFYKNRKLKNLFVKNNVNKPEHESSLIYKYTCKKVPCSEANAFYIGLITIILKERFKQS